MNVLFLTLYSFNSLQERNIYPDLLREFVKNGHEVYVISPSEKRENKPTHIVKEDHATILRLQIGNTQKTNIIEKGISTLLIEPQFTAAIKKYFSNVKFDLILYSTPPITLVSAIEYVKRRDGAKSYLLLKDIFPQNAVDIGLMSKNGVKGLLYKHFRRQEKRLYRISDRIGCMSQANVDYVIKHNPEVNPAIVEVCPNSVDAMDITLDAEDKMLIRSKYGIPQDKIVFVYGGNLGKPQGIDFVMQCLKSQRNQESVYFIIVGDGTDYPKLAQFLERENLKNVSLMRWIPREDFDRLLAASDVGLIFLDHRFTIPNFPSRLLNILQAGLPVLACTDSNTDVGLEIEKYGMGKWCESNSVEAFSSLVSELAGLSETERVQIHQRDADYLQNVCNVKICYELIENSVGENVEDTID